MSEHQKKYSESHVGQDWHHPNCFGCGPLNRNSMQASFDFDEKNGEVTFSYTVKEAFEGAPGYAHGGALATLLDEAQGCLCFHLGHFVMTDTLYMDYAKAVPLNEPVTINARLTLVRRRRLYTKATIHNQNGDLLASSKARWFILQPRVLEKLFQGRMPAEEQERLRIVLEMNRARNRRIRQKIKNTK